MQQSSSLCPFEPFPFSSIHSSLLAVKQTWNTAILPTNSSISNAATLAANSKTERVSGALATATTVCLRRVACQICREQRIPARASKSMVTGQLQLRSAILQFTRIPVSRNTRATNRITVSSEEALQRHQQCQHTATDEQIDGQHG